MMMSPSEEAEMHREQLARLDELLPRYERELEAAKRADAEYDAEMARISGEINRLMLTYGGRWTDQGGQWPDEVVADRGRPIPNEARLRFRQLCGARRDLERRRQDYLRNGGMGWTMAYQRYEQARIARAVVAAAVAGGY